MTISVIIPTYNEADKVGELVKFLRNCGGDVVEIIVVDGLSNDNTDGAARDAGATLINSPVRCRAAQMNLGASHSSGEVLYFVHADVSVLSTFVLDIQEYLSQGYSAGCYRYVFDSEKRMLKINAFFTRFNSLLCRGGDQTLFVRADIFRQMRGFNEYYTIMEDYDFIIRLRRSFKFAIIPKNVRVSARKYDNNSWLRVQLSNLIIFIMFYLKASPDEMKKAYHRLLDYR